MMNMLLKIQDLIKRTGLRSLAGPVLIVMILAMMVLPLPPFLLDILFTFNIALAVMVLLVSMNTTKALDFSVFPTVLLITTLLRLSLNVASTAPRSVSALVATSLPRKLGDSPLAATRRSI